MVKNLQSRARYKILAVILLAVSVLFRFLQNPIYNWLFATGQIAIADAPALTEQQLEALAAHAFRPIFTFPLFLFILEAVLFGVCVLLKSDQIASKFLPAALTVDLVSRVISIVSVIRLIAAYGRYPASMAEVVGPVISRYTASVILQAVSLSAFVILLVDSLTKHRFLKLSRVLVLIFSAAPLSQHP